MWVRGLTVLALVAALFWPNLQRLWLKTNPFTGEANWAHSMFVPLIGLYYLYLNREALQAARRAKRASQGRRALGTWTQVQFVLWGLAVLTWGYYPPAILKSAMLTAVVGGLVVLGAATGLVAWAGRGKAQSSAGRIVARMAESSATWFGFYLMLWGMVLFAWAIWPGRNDFLKDLGMVVSVFGVVLLLCGWGVMKVAWFPVVFLVAALPWPELFYSRVALPLQKGAATAATAGLRMTKVDATREGTVITIRRPDGTKRQLNVAEACAGLKSLMTFIAIGATIGFLSSRQMWQKVAITLSAIPIAIFANMLRVAGQGLLDHYVSEKLSESFAHQFVGLVMLIPAFLLMLAVAWMVDRLVVEEVDKRRLTDGKGPQEPLVIRIPRSRRGAPAVEAATTSPAAASAPAAPAPHPVTAGDEDSSDLAAATRRLMAMRQSKRQEGQSATGSASPRQEEK